MHVIVRMTIHSGQHSSRPAIGLRARQYKPVLIGWHEVLSSKISRCYFSTPPSGNGQPAFEHLPRDARRSFHSGHHDTGIGMVVYESELKDEHFFNSLFINDPKRSSRNEMLSSLIVRLKS